MWRPIAAVFLLPAMAAAQNPSPTQFLQGDLPRPTYGSFTEQQAIRQGTSERADFFVSLGNPVVAPGETSRDVVPFKIEFDPGDGITVREVRFPPREMMRVALQNNAERLHAPLDPPLESAAKADSPGISRTPPVIPSQDEMSRVTVANPVIAVLNPTFAIRLKVKVPSSATPGVHQLHGHITYQPIRADGLFPPQRTEIVVPITVVDRNAPVHKNSVYGHTMGSNSGNHDLIWMILMAPILVPLSILAAIVGMDC